MKPKTKRILKIIIEAIVFIILATIIVNLLKENKDIIANNKEENAQDKLDKVIKTFSTSNNSTLEDIITNTEGVETVKINKETGEHIVKIDGKEYTIVSQEIIFDEIEYWNKCAQLGCNGNFNIFSLLLIKL